jgi:hypothetical protein
MTEKKKTTKKKKTIPREEDLVRKYAQRVINNQRLHGRVDESKFKGIKYNSNKKTWMDTDFYFSIVFQNSEQKNKFLQAVSWTSEDMEGVEIVNGLKLAEHLGVKLEKITSKDYPMADLALKDLILDVENF